MFTEISVLENKSLIFLMNSLGAKSSVASPVREVRKDVMPSHTKVSFRLFSPIKMSWVFVLSKYRGFITMLNILFFSIGCNCDLCDELSARLA